MNKKVTNVCYIYGSSFRGELFTLMSEDIVRDVNVMT